MREERIRLQMRADWRAQRRVLTRMHAAMFPREVPEVAGVELAAAFATAPDRLDIGGDWYDVLPLEDGVLLAVGDIAGHDGAATAVMGPVRAVLRAYAMEDPQPASVLARLNRFVLASYRDDTYVTALVARYEPASRRLTVANAGHPAPLLLRQAMPPKAVSLTEPGPALGILADAEFASLQLTLEQGMALCLYTDGLTDPRADLFAPRASRLAEAAAEAYRKVTSVPGGGVPVAELLADELMRRMRTGSTVVDDACLAVLRVPLLD